MANQYVRRAKKEIKKTHPVTVLIALVIFILGFAGGGLASYKICEEDGFSLKGEKNITLALGERYEEAGFTAVSFGRDISARVLVDDSRSIIPRRASIISSTGSKRISSSAAASLCAISR